MLIFNCGELLASTVDDPDFSLAFLFHLWSPFPIPHPENISCQADWPTEAKLFIYDSMV
jgi:hypothetical protein